MRKIRAAIAQHVASCCNSDFNSIINDPEQIFEWETTATIENNGLYPHHPNTPLLSILRALHDPLLCGHGWIAAWILFAIKVSEHIWIVDTVAFSGKIKDQLTVAQCYTTSDRARLSPH